jgi:uridine kinase
MSKLINKICKKIILKKNDIFIIGIDGPTAAGKTILAEKLEKKLKNF